MTESIKKTVEEIKLLLGESRISLSPVTEVRLEIILRANMRRASQESIVDVLQKIIAYMEENR